MDRRGWLDPRRSGTLDLSPYMRGVVREAAARILERQRVRAVVKSLANLAAAEGKAKGATE